jgi:Protein of unknown function (DUF3995)
MIDAIAIVLFVMLASIALLHAYWAAGGLWPGRDEADLARRVTGEPRRTRLPPVWMTWAVAGAIGVAALWPLFASGLVHLPVPHALVLGIAGLIGLGFLLRGIAGFTPAWRRSHAAEPLAQRDRQLFSPLCLILAAGYATLVMKGGSA